MLDMRYEGHCGPVKVIKRNICVIPGRGGIWVEVCLKTLLVSEELVKIIVFSNKSFPTSRMYIAKS